MYVLFDFTPRFCPHCGSEWKRNWRPEASCRADYRSGASFSCRDCHLDYQYVPTAVLLDAADAGEGDLKRHAQNEGWRA